MGLVVISDTSAEPVSLAQAKNQLRVSHNDEDGYIAGLICTARELVEKATNRKILTTSYRLTLPCFPSSRVIEVPRPPLQSVTKIDYVDTAGATQTLSTTVYGVDTTAEPGFIYRQPDESWPSTKAYLPNAVTIDFVAGWSTSTAIPKTLIHAILLSLAHLYENRELVSLEKSVRPEMIPGLEDLLTLNVVPQVP